jgi:hypothetical protein
VASLIVENGPATMPPLRRTYHRESRCSISKAAACVVFYRAEDVEDCSALHQHPTRQCPSLAACEGVEVLLRPEVNIGTWPGLRRLGSLCRGVAALPRRRRHHLSAAAASRPSGIGRPSPRPAHGGGRVVPSLRDLAVLGFGAGRRFGHHRQNTPQRGPCDDVGRYFFGRRSLPPTHLRFGLADYACGLVRPHGAAVLSRRHCLFDLI